MWVGGGGARGVWKEGGGEHEGRGRKKRKRIPPTHPDTHESRMETARVCGCGRVGEGWGHARRLGRRRREKRRTGRKKKEWRPTAQRLKSQDWKCALLRQSRLTFCLTLKRFCLADCQTTTPKTKRLKSQGWEGEGAREAFGEKEEGTKKDGAERREDEYHPPTQTLTSQEWRLRVCGGVWVGRGGGTRGVWDGGGGRKEGRVEKREGE